jgi:hypothetical protein
VTSLSAAEVDARTLYEQVYCARGEVETRIKEQQLDLFAGRTSAATMRANQLRLWFASFAYVLLEALRRIGLRFTQFANRHLRHHPAQAPEDRRPGAPQRAPDQGRDGLSLSVPDRVPPRLPLPAARRLLTVPSTAPRTARAAAIARLEGAAKPQPPTETAAPVTSCVPTVKPPAAPIGCEKSGLAGTSIP